MPEKSTNTMYKVSTITTERGFTMDGQFTTIADLANIAEGVLTFPTIAEAVAAARDYAEARGFKYLEIGDTSTPALGETFVEIRIA